MNSASTTTQPDHKPIAAKAFEWLQAYRTLINEREGLPVPAAVPRREGTPYEEWATLTIVYMLLGFSRNMFPMTQLQTLVPLPPDFVAQVGEALRALEADVPL
jgi:hypothetical protein